MLQKIYKAIFGDYNEKYIKSLQPIVHKINQLEEEYQKLSEEDLLKNTEKFKQRIKNGESLDNLLIESFATVKNACRRLVEKKHKFLLGKKEVEWNMIPFDVQLVGGIVLHRRNIAEMKTGEGKTLVSVAPLYLNALTENGAHLVTVNEYLAERDAHWMGQVFEYLGLKVGIVKHGQSPEEKRSQYACDITYATNNELGFDYLRDNMASHSERQVMRNLNFAIIDEVDSILIDEARTPLIISASAEESTDKYKQYARLVNQLIKDTHYVIDEKERAVTLTEEGIHKMEDLLGISNIYTEKGFEEVHHIESSLKAQAIFQKDIDYVVKDEEILIVDEFTGRIMPGRRYSGGLHQAIEAKENVEIKRQSRTLASITFQNFFRMYKKLAGMTGTAETEAKEFAEIYKLDTIIIPTDKPVARVDKPDAIFKSLNGKYQAIIRKVKESNKKGQPILIGTISIEKSEVLSQILSKEGIHHSVLNAKHHEKEAEIISRAGEKGAITIATNMAGRGTDIKLTPESMEAGGLLVLATERHDSRRIDNQLRGRSGRQGDPGESQFYVSMDDDLMRIFGSDRMKKMMEMMGVPDDMPIENKMISNAIESAQKKVEIRNFEIRKHVLQYDDVMNKHREIIYEKRTKILNNENIKEEIINLMKKYIAQIIEEHINGIKQTSWNYEEIINSLTKLGKVQLPDAETLKEETENKSENLIDFIVELFLNTYQEKEKLLPDLEMLRYAEKAVYLRNIDLLWMEHIDEMSRLRETVSLRAYGNKNPLFEYKNEAFISFRTLIFNISINTIRELMSMEINIESPIEVKRVAPRVEDMKTNEDQIEGELEKSHILLNKPAEAIENKTIFSSPSNNEDGIKVYKVDNSPEEKIEKVGRNDVCPCGSGKKYKKCCGK